jgi:hypothetical protein
MRARRLELYLLKPVNTQRIGFLGIREAFWSLSELLRILQRAVGDVLDWSWLKMDSWAAILRIQCVFCQDIVELTRLKTPQPFDRMIDHKQFGFAYVGRRSTHRPLSRSRVSWAWTRNPDNLHEKAAALNAAEY